MKKNLFRLMSMLMITLAVFTFASCGSDGGSDDNNTTNNDGNGGNTPDTPTINDKAFLEETGQLLVNAFGKHDFDNFKPIRQVLEDERYDASDMGNHFNDVTESFKDIVSSPTSSNYHTYMIIASGYYGNYSVVNNRWQYSSSTTGATFTFPDNNGQQVVATVTASGNAKQVFFVKEGRKEIGAAVPERIDINVTQGGQNIITATATFNLNNIAENARFDLSSNNLDVTAKVVINGRYTIDVSKVKYVANGESSASFSISNGSAVIVSGNAIANTRISNPSYDKVDLNSLTAISVSVDILGRVQIKGQCSDGVALKDALDDLKDYRYDENEYKNALNRINNLYTAQTFYNGDGTVRANMMLEPYSKTSYSSQQRWDNKPVIIFTSDGSKYAFDEYFTGSQFPAVWEGIKDLVNTVAANFTDERIDW